MYGVPPGLSGALGTERAARPDRGANAVTGQAPMCSLSGQQCGSSRTEQHAEIPPESPNQALEEGKGEARQPRVLLYQLLGLDSR